MRRDTHIVLVPGMLAPTFYLQPLKKFLETSGYSTSIVSLNLSIPCLDTLVSKLYNHCKDISAENIVFIAHSHGGRVAYAASVHEKRVRKIITLGSPISSLRPQVTSWKIRLYNILSCAMRSWPNVLNGSRAVKSVGIYSLQDGVVSPEYARQDYPGILIELPNLSHSDLVNPSCIGDLLLQKIDI